MQTNKKSEAERTISIAGDELRALNHTLCPEAATARGERIAEAVLLIFIQEVAAAAGSAGRKRKSLNTFAESYMLRIVPEF